MYREPNRELVEEAIETLKKQFPTARPRLIEVLVECIELHARKNNDYNGDMDLYRATGVVGRFCDIWRKVIRLFNAIIQKTEMVVSENTIETSNDMIVYTALLTEELELEKLKQERE